jgi:hypothetical protein
MELTSGVPIASVTSSSHEVAINYSGKLRPDQPQGREDRRQQGLPQRYTWPAARSKPASCSTPAEETFYADAGAASLGQNPKPSCLGSIFIVDVSGSMHGFSILPRP